MAHMAKQRTRVLWMMGAVTAVLTVLGAMTGASEAALALLGSPPTAYYVYLPLVLRDPTPTATPSPTPTNTPAPPPAVSILCSQTYKSFEPWLSNSYWLVGELRNDTSGSVEGVEVRYDVYDAEGIPVDQWGYVSAYPDLLGPGDEAAFMVSYTANPDWTCIIDRVQWQTALRAPQYLQMQIIETGYWSGSHSYYAKVEAKNQYSSTVGPVKAYITVYNRSILGEECAWRANYKFVQSTLLPGDTVTFNVYGYIGDLVNFRRITRWKVQVIAATIE